MFIHVSCLLSLMTSVQVKAHRHSRRMAVAASESAINHDPTIVQCPLR